MIKEGLSHIVSAMPRFAWRPGWQVDRHFAAIPEDTAPEILKQPLPDVLVYPFHLDSVLHPQVAYFISVDLSEKLRQGVSLPWRSLVESLHMREVFMEADDPKAQAYASSDGLVQRDLLVQPDATYGRYFDRDNELLMNFSWSNPYKNGSWINSTYLNCEVDLVKGSEHLSLGLYGTPERDKFDLMIATADLNYPSEPLMVSSGTFDRDGSPLSP